MKNKCADTVADILVEKIILRFGNASGYSQRPGEGV